MDTLITEYLYCMCGGIVFAAFCFNGDKFSSILQYKFTHFSEKMEHENHIFHNKHFMSERERIFKCLFYCGLERLRV